MWSHRLTQCSTDVNFIASHALARSQQQSQRTGGKENDIDAKDAMTALERQAFAPVGFLAAGAAVKEGTLQPNHEDVAENPDALNLDVDD